MPRYGEKEAREAVALSRTYSEVLRRLGLRPAGGNHALLRHWVDDIWQIPTAHFDGGASVRRSFRSAVPMAEVLVRDSSYSRANLKRRLFQEGYKDRRCEMCGQDERWNGRWMSLILDHINGIPDDNRIAKTANCLPQLRGNPRHPLREEESSRAASAGMCPV
jgi:hypothetical protein